MLAKAVLVLGVVLLVANRLLHLIGPQSLAVQGGTSIMTAVVSIAVLGSGLWIVLSKKYDVESQKWAFGAIGTILGFWLSPGA